MYQADPDPYCYPGSAVLKNKADLKTSRALKQFGTAMTFARAEEPLPAGRFSVRHYRNIHHHLFQDVYTWAGRYRTVRLSKGESSFCYPEYIATEMTRLFTGLKAARQLRDLEPAEFAKASAHFLAELNAIHPFREGNGRTQNAFLTMFATSAGHRVDLRRLRPKPMLSAMVASFNGNETPLEAIILKLIY